MLGQIHNINKCTKQQKTPIFDKKKIQVKIKIEDRYLHNHPNGTADTRHPVDKGDRYGLESIVIVPVLGAHHCINEEPPT